MAQITVNIPNDKISDVVEAFATGYGWTTGSGVTKAQFAKQVVADFVKRTYQNYVVENAATQARESAAASMSTIDIN
jgi:hypothetical protein